MTVDAIRLVVVLAPIHCPIETFPDALLELVAARCGAPAQSFTRRPNFVWNKSWRRSANGQNGFSPWAYPGWTSRGLQDHLLDAAGALSRADPGSLNLRVWVCDAGGPV